MYNTPTEGGMTLKQAAVFHCKNVSVNQFSMLIAPPSEGGVISNPADSDPWVPLGEGEAGMVQAAARFSQMALTTCPQATGVVIGECNCFSFSAFRCVSMLIACFLCLSCADKACVATAQTTSCSSTSGRTRPQAV